VDFPGNQGETLKTVEKKFGTGFETLRFISYQGVQMKTL